MGTTVASGMRARAHGGERASDRADSAVRHWTRLGNTLYAMHPVRDNGFLLNMRNARHNKPLKLRLLAYGIVW